MEINYSLFTIFANKEEFVYNNQDSKIVLHNIDAVKSDAYKSIGILLNDINNKPDIKEFIIKKYKIKII